MFMYRAILSLVLVVFSALSVADERCRTPKISAFAAERIVLANIKGFLEAVEMAEGKFPNRLQYNSDSIKIDRESPCYWVVGIDRMRKSSHMRHQYKVSKITGDISILPRR